MIHWICQEKKIGWMALISNLETEGEGFEPPSRLLVKRFSRPPPSATRPSLRCSVRRVDILTFYAFLGKCNARVMSGQAKKMNNP